MNFNQSISRVFFSFTIIALLSLIGCGGTGDDTTGSSTFGGAGGGGLGPNPEPIFDLPNTLPNNFYTASCPILASHTEVRDLEVIISGSATAIDTDGDNDDDTVLVKRNASAIEMDLFQFEAKNLNGTPIPPTVLMGGGGASRLSAGRIFDSTGTLILPTAPTAFQTDLVHVSSILTAWVPTYVNPVLRQGYDPNDFSVHANPAGGVFDAYGAGGFEGILDEGVYAWAINIFNDISFTHHCTENAFKMVVCPYSGDVDTNGNEVCCDSDANQIACP